MVMRWGDGCSPDASMRDDCVHAALNLSAPRQKRFPFLSLGKWLIEAIVANLECLRQPSHFWSFVRRWRERHCNWWYELLSWWLFWWLDCEAVWKYSVVFRKRKIVCFLTYPDWQFSYVSIWLYNIIQRGFRNSESLLLKHKSK